MTLCIKEELSYHFSKGYEGDLIMKSAEEITVVNVFNPNIRKIKCIENELDYLGDGTFFVKIILRKEKFIHLSEEK